MPEETDNQTTPPQFPKQLTDVGQFLSSLPDGALVTLTAPIPSNGDEADDE